MAEKKISELDAAEALDGAELLEVSQNIGGTLVPRKATAQSIAELGMNNPMTTAGDLIIAGTDGIPTRLAPGTNGHVLKVVGGVPVYAAESGGGGGSGVVETIVAGAGISVNSADPANPVVSATGGGTGLPGTGWAAYLAASLEPDAIEAIQKGTFSYSVSSSVTKLLMASWSTRLGSTGRMEQRNPQRFFPLRGATLAGIEAASSALIIDPALPVYTDPWGTYYERLQEIMELPTRYIPLTAAGQAKPLLPGPYGAIITQATCFNLAWVIWRFGGATGPGFNLMNEESDAAAQRVGESMFLPVSKRVAGSVESSPASVATPSGSVSMVILPSTWSVIDDPVASSYDFRDDFMGAALDTGVWTRVQSSAGNVEISSTYQWCKLQGNSTFGANALYRTAATTRAAGIAMVVDIYAPYASGTTGVGMVGWSDGGGHAVANFAHGVNLSGNTPALTVFEGGTSRGGVGAGWTPGCIYRFRITLAASGATYEVQGGIEYPAIGGSTWTNITPGTTSGTTASLHPAAAAYAGEAYISDFREFS